MFLATLFCCSSLALAEDPRREKIIAEVKKMDINGLTLSIVSVGWDLREYDKYHCYYDPEKEPKACDRMDTVSGQYEDLYWSEMANCRGSRLCPGGNYDTSFSVYVMDNKRICADLKTNECTKISLTKEQMQDELVDLLIFKEDHKR